MTFVALAAVSGLSILACREWRLTVWYPIKASGLFSLVMLTALARLRQYHPFPSFGVANLVTTARAALGVLLTSLIGESVSGRLAATAASVALVVLALDGLDGWLARRANMLSAFGARFDVEVDALLIQTLAILAWQEGKAGPWVVLS